MPAERMQPAPAGADRDPPFADRAGTRPARRRPGPGTSPTRSASARSSSAQAGGAASAPAPRAVAESSSSAARIAAVPAQVDSSGPATATIPSTPPQRSASAARMPGSAGGSTSPDVRAVGCSTARAAFTRSSRAELGTRVTRCSSSPVDRHPNRVVIRSAGQPAIGPVADLRGGLDQHASPARTIRAAAAITSSTSVSDQDTCGISAEHLAEHSHQVVADRLEESLPRCCSYPHSGEGHRHSGADKAPDQGRKLTLFKDPVFKAPWGGMRRVPDDASTRSAIRRPGPRSHSGGEHRVHVADDLAAAQRVEPMSTAVPTTVAAELARPGETSDEGAAGGEHVVDEQHARAAAMSSCASMVAVAVLERVDDGCRGPGQLARLADRHEAGARLHRCGSREQEPARLDAGHDVEAPAKGAISAWITVRRAEASASRGVMSRNSTPGSG